MTGSELTERLISDVKNAIQAKNVTRSHEQYKKDMLRNAYDPDYDMNHSIEELYIAGACSISLPYALANKDLLNMINHYEVILTNQGNDKVDLNEFLIQLEEKKEKLSHNIDRIKDNQSLMFVSAVGSEPLFNLLKNQLDYIHEDATIVYNCLEILKSKNNK